jgi:murein DD-endopeptidase MepM/ murein hydrolase activator NlpD
MLRVARALAARFRRDPRLLIAGGYLALAGLAAAVSLAQARSERAQFLYFPPFWAHRSLLSAMTPPADNEGSGPGAGFVGGGATAVLPLDIKRYVVKEGETLSGIAERLDLDLDTLASLNRQWGSGVHLVRVGEEILVPNQDGIYLAVEASLEKLCAAKGVPVEAVLAVNRIPAGEVKPGVRLFFPGVQHTGIERSVIVGSAFLRPVAGWASSAFGYRHDPFNDSIQFHRGIDLAAAPGTAVRAALDGKVTVTATDPVLGLYIVIRHQVGFSTVYGHLAQAFVRPGDTVARGARIGQVGSTGKTTGPHLHFEVRRSGRPVNPAGVWSTRH